MTFHYKLSKLALEDINSIWEYSALMWNIKQANNYYDELFVGINSICDNPEIGKSIKEVKDNHRALVVRSHMIIYKIENNKILVDRILNQKMDIENHL